MINLVTTMSRYLMILLILIYTYYNFRFFSLPDDESKLRLCRLQNVPLFLIFLLSGTIIYLQTEDEAVVLFFGAQLVFFVLYQLLYRLFYRNASRLLLNNTCMLLCTSFIMLTRISMDKAVRQFIIMAVAAVITMIIPYEIDRTWQLAKIPWVYGLIGLALLLVVCVIGNTSFGAQLSISIGGFSFQPSEFVKISFVFFVATMFYRSTEFKNVAITTGVAAAHVLILVLSKDLGSALIFFLAYVLMLFIATSNWLYLAGGLGSGCAAAMLAYKLFSHVRVRVEAWQDPWSDIAGKGYQAGALCDRHRRLVWHGTLPGDAEEDPGCREGLHFRGDLGGAGRHLCALYSPDLSGLLHAVHADCDPDASIILQADRVWSGN